MLDDAKITAYLLTDRHPQNQGKARFFMLFGFVPANWRRSKAALLEHPLVNPVVRQTPFRYGTMSEVVCSIASPDGRNRCIRSFWAIEPPAAGPKVITAYAAAPSPRGRARP